MQGHGHSWLRNKKIKDSAKLKNTIHSNNYNKQSFPKILVSANFHFYSSSKLSEAGTVNRRKRKNEEVRNDDKKMKQIRILLYQLYPIYKIQN